MQRETDADQLPLSLPFALLSSLRSSLSWRNRRQHRERGRLRVQRVRQRSGSRARVGVSACEKGKREQSSSATAAASTAVATCLRSATLSALHALCSALTLNTAFPCERVSHRVRERERESRR